MAILFRPASTNNEYAACHEIQREVFYDELNCFNMAIPDRYDSDALYIRIMLSEVGAIGTYRMILPSADRKLPIQEVWDGITQFPHSDVCEISRLVIRKSFRGQIPFHRIFQSVEAIAKTYNISLLTGLTLLRNVRLFKRYGFFPATDPLYDPSVFSPQAGQPNVVPMLMPIDDASPHIPEPGRLPQVNQAIASTYRLDCNQ